MKSHKRLSEIMNNTLAFTYDTLDESSSMIVRQRTSEIKSLMRSTAQGIVEIGHKLIEVKEALPHGEFGNWLDAEFGWSERTAQNFMNVASNFKSANFADLQIAPSALYMLSAPSTPETARQEAIQRAEQGESISHSTAKEITDNHKGASIEKPTTEETYTPTGNGFKSLVDPETGEVFDEPTAHVSHNSGNNEWYTPPEIIDAARRVMGSIDLDPASCQPANQIVRAKTFFDEIDNGLEKQWHGNIWMNPPYSQPLIDEFIEKLTKEDFSQAVVLTNNATETRWGSRLLNSCNAICFPKGRIRFVDRHGNPGSAPLQGQMIAYFGDNTGGFNYEFSDFGVCLVKQ